MDVDKMQALDWSDALSITFIAVKSLDMTFPRLTSTV